MTPITGYAPQSVALSANDRLTIGDRVDHTFWKLWELKFAVSSGDIVRGQGPCHSSTTYPSQLLLPRHLGPLRQSRAACLRQVGPSTSILCWARRQNYSLLYITTPSTL